MGDEGESNLEMRCSADEAWYDGTLQVSPESKDLIVVHFNDFDEDEDETFHRSELRDPAKLRSRVRRRSVQLQDSQCRRVYEGQKICGCLDDGEDRKYYDAEVTAIAKRKHAPKDDGEECLCRFTVFWLDGPSKREETVIGCAEVCFLSMEDPEDDPMVKNLLQTMPSYGDQGRRKLVKSVTKSAPKGAPKDVPKIVAKSVPSPRPRTPSPSLELAPSKKQPSKEPSPAADVTSQKVPELAKTKSLPIGSKKKRIMQAEEQLTNLASNSDELETDGRGISLKDSYHRSGETDEAATGHGDEIVGAGRRVMNGASEGKKGSVQGGGRKRVVKGKAKARTPEVVGREEAAREENNAPRPTGTPKERLKLKTKRMAASDKAGRQDSTQVTQSLAERVKLMKAQKNPDAAAPDAAAAVSSPAAVPDEATKQDNIVQSLAERVKLSKTAQKQPSVSPIDAHKHSLQKIGKQFVKTQVTKRKLIQLDDPSPDPLKSKFDKVVKPRTASKPKEVAAEPSKVVEPFKVVEPSKVVELSKVAESTKDVAEQSKVAEPSSVEPSTVKSNRPRMQKRKAGRPRKNPPPKPAKLVPESTTTNKQLVVEIPSEHKQSPQEEEMVDANADKWSSDITPKKRPRDEGRSQHVSDFVYSEIYSDDDETLDAHVRRQANKGKKKKLIIGDFDRDEFPHDDSVSEKSAHTIMGEDDHEDDSPHSSYKDELAIEVPGRAVNKVSIADKMRDIQNKFHNGDTLSSPQAARELISLAGLDPFHNNPLEDQHFIRSSSPLDINSDSHLELTGDETGASGRRRLVKKRLQVVMTDDEMEDEAVPSSREEQQQHGDDNECSPKSDPKITANGAELELELEHQVVVQKHQNAGVNMETSRVLMLENMETDASALDAMKLLQDNTEGVCAVHVLPVLEFQASATGYALYCDSGSALKALRWLTSMSRYVVSPNGRPWIVSQVKEIYQPSMCGFAAHTAYKSDNPGMCGIISDQPHAHDLVVVTKHDRSAYSKARQMSKSHEEHKKWQKELYERILEHEKKV